MRRRTILLAGLGLGAAGSVGVLALRGQRPPAEPGPRGEFRETTAPPPGRDGWKASVSAGFWGTPVLDAEHGQLMLYDNDGAVYSLDATTGTTRWRTQADGQMSSLLHLIGPSLVVEGADGVHAFDRATGRQRWKYPTKRPAPVAPQTAPGRVILADPDGALVSLDPESGGVAWRIEPTHRAGNFGNLQASIAGDTAVAVFPTVVGGQYSTRLVAVGLSSGDYRWTLDAEIRHGFRWIGPGAAGQVLATHGRTVGSAGDDPNAQAAYLAAVEERTGKRAWTFQAYRIEGNPLVSGDMAYVQSRTAFDAPIQLHALDLGTGQARWTQKLTAEQTQIVEQGATLATDAGVICMAGVGGVVALDATTGASRWTHPSQGVTFQLYSLRTQAGIVYLPGQMQTQGGVYRWRIEDGKELQRLWPQVIGSQVVITGDAIYLTSETSVHAIPIQATA